MNSWRKSTRSIGNGECVEVAAWRKSSRSNSQGACVEVADWRKATRSMSNGDCVEAGNGPGVIGVRDSKDPGPVLEVTPESWGAFLSRIQAGAAR